MAQGFQYQLEARGCGFQQGTLGVKGPALFLGSEMRDVSVTITGDGEQQFGSCAFYNATLTTALLSTVSSDKSRVVVRNSQFLDQSKVAVPYVGCDPGGNQGFKTGTAARCDRRARCEEVADDPAIVAGIRCTCAVP
jgi:hypothetical protein